MLQVEVGVPGARTRIPLSRIDWRPANRGHKNPLRGPAAHAGRFLPDSHLHTFALNWLPQASAMRAGNLPFAVDLPAFVDTLDALFDFAGFVFRIDHMTMIEMPPWLPRLL
ncbi:MAG: hypothetical protein P4L71_09760 [Acetobacteraceae bacterium]|nr:hypothetical protein [Acetobacteraceae bacterium]